MALIRAMRARFEPYGIQLDGRGIEFGARTPKIARTYLQKSGAGDSMRKMLPAQQKAPVAK